VRLPAKLHEHHVILCDATIATGAAALMAIRVLLVCQQSYSILIIAHRQDYDVPEENIIFISVIAASPGKNYFKTR